MGIDVTVLDGQGSGNELGVVKPQTMLPNGVVAFTEPYRKGANSSLIYINDTYGVDLNQSAVFTGTPEGIHNGTDTVLWTASALSGTWTFDSTTQAQAGTKSIDASSAGNNREMQLQDGTSITVNDYVALSGWIYITSWVVDSSQVSFRTRNSGVEQGNTLNLSDHITVSTMNSWQKFSIPMSAFGLAGTDIIDQLVIKQEASAPNYFLDTLQWEETGGSIPFTVRPRPGTIFHIKNATFFVAATENSTLADASMQNITYTEFFGLSTLTIGVSLETQQGGISRSLGFARDIGDLLLTCTSFTTGGNGTSTWYKITNEFFGPQTVMNSLNEDSRTVRVNDDLSGLLRLRVLLNGWEEKITTMNETSIS